MSESKKPSTGYSVCQAMVELIEAEQANLRKMQRLRPDPMESYTAEVYKLTNSCAVLQGEIRKTGDDADKAVNNLPPEKRVALILGMLRELSPEHRIAVQLFLEELGTKLL